MVVHSEEETNGIEAPAITLFVVKETGVAMLTLGWKTFDNSVTYDTRSLFPNSSASHLWTKDMTATFSGRYFTLRLSRTITRKESDAILFRVDTTSSLIYTFFVHDENFFLMNINPFSLPGKRWQLNGNILNASGYSHDLTLTRHNRLNLEKRPCEEDLAYSFTVCVKEKLSAKVGCRLPWDKWSRDRAECTNKTQFEKFELFYLGLINADADFISNITGCKMPCHYKVYKFVESSPNQIPNPSSAAFWAASHKTQVEEEVLLYPFTSLVAEFGGSLGLFLGFSFLAIWQDIREYFCSS